MGGKQIDFCILLFMGPTSVRPSAAAGHVLLDTNSLASQRVAVVKSWS